MTEQLKPPKGQSKRWSLIESIVNMVVGFGVAMLATYFVFPLFGLVVTLHENFLITVIFTTISLVRSYVLRRIFNWDQQWLIAKSRNQTGLKSPTAVRTLTLLGARSAVGRHTKPSQ